MIHPIKINLFLKNNSSLKTLNIIGGDPKDLIKKVNNNIYKYLYGNNSQINSIIFEFDDNMNKQNILESTYLAKGNITAIFGIKINFVSNNNLSYIPKTELILRMIDINFAEIELNNFITNYINDKILFTENIIDIYLYGNVYDRDKKKISPYILTKKYIDYNIIYMLDYYETIEYFESLLLFLQKLETNNYFYRDLKFSNIGLEIINGKLIFIILDNVISS